MFRTPVFVYDTRRHFLARLDADVSFSLPARVYHGLINAMACKEILPVCHEILTYQQFQKRANNVNAKDIEAATCVKTSNYLQVVKNVTVKADSPLRPVDATNSTSQVLLQRASVDIGETMSI